MKVVQALAQITYTALMILFTGYTYSCLWNWFVVGTFQAPVISIPVAIGLSLFVAMFKKVDQGDTLHENHLAFQNAAIFLKPALVLLTAYVAKSFM